MNSLQHMADEGREYSDAVALLIDPLVVSVQFLRPYSICRDRILFKHFFL